MATNEIQKLECYETELKFRDLLCTCLTVLLIKIV